MSKADELSKKMEQKAPAIFTPRESVAVRPLPVSPTAATPKAAPVAAPAPKKPAKQDKPELVPLYTKIPKDSKRWLDHRRVDTGQELGEIVAEAIQLFKKQVEKNK